MEQENLSTKPSFWDRPLFSRIRINWRTLLIALIVVLLIFTRLWDLGNRSFGHDESIHAWESWKLETGQGYRQDPVYHGPILYHCVAFIYFLFGVSEVNARIFPALLSVVLVLLVLPLRRWLGRAGSWFAIFLLTISPTLMLRGRYLRHDIWLMVAAMVMLFCFFQYLEDRKERWLYILAAAQSAAFCAISGAFIYGAIFGAFWLVYLVLEWVRTRKPLKELPVFDLVVLMATLAMPLAAPVFSKALKFDSLDYSNTGMLRSFAIVITLLIVSAVIGIWWKRKVWLISAGIYYAIYILLYTTLFTNARGMATGMVGMLGYWLTQQGVARGGQPWYYFYFLNVIYEYLPLLLGGLAIVYYAVTGRRKPKPELPARQRAAEPTPVRLPFTELILWWALAMFAVWTWVGEKMPWQNMHLVLPLILLGGWFLGQVWERTDWNKLRQAGVLQVVVLLPLALFALKTLLGTLVNPVRPFAGMELDQLEVTLRWVLSLVVFLISVGLMAYWGRGLGRGGWARVVLAATFVVLAAFTLRAALMASFDNQDYATEFMMYADSTPDTGMVVRELEDMSRRFAGDKTLKIAYDNDSSWPMVWYLRDFNTSFFAGDSGVGTDAQVVIVGNENEAKVKGQLSGKYVRRQYRLIWWPNMDVYFHLSPSSLWKDLKDPARRRYWWDIWYYRKYPQSTTAWPYVHTFAMYVRKDLAAQIWNYGPEVTGKTLELPEDEYEKKRVQTSAVAVYGAFGSEDGQFNYPKSAALDAQGNLYVCDTYNHRVQVFDTSGTLLRQWGGKGNAPGQFQEPWGIALDKAGNVYVADTWNHRVEKFDAQGKFLKQWGSFGDTAGALDDGNTFYGPRDLAIDVDGNVLVADTGNKRICKFTSEGEFVQQFGGAGSLSGQFREPVGIAVGRDGNVYVADTWNQRIQKFMPDMTYAAEWPVVGWEGESVVNKPYLTVDSKGNVYFTAPEYHRVAELDGSGKVVAVWGQFGSDLSGLNMPSGIAVDAQDNVYVVDSANHRVVKYAAR